MKARSARSKPRSANDEFLGFTGSLHFDKRLWRYDLAGSIAHAQTLVGAGVLTEKEKIQIVSSLRQLAEELSDGKLEPDPAAEDIHMSIEKMLIARIGQVGGKLHTGRSRNDQVALDLRLMVREAISDIVSGSVGLQTVLLEKAAGAQTATLPGYTHMQHAQPVLLSHHLLAHFWRLERDISRLSDCSARMNISPLGSGALAGTSFELDRQEAARLLGMDDVTENSLDAVSDRDFVAETAFALSLLMIHLSSLAEELVLWSSREFGFLKLPKDLSSGSSMMPQKRNPDIPELVRGKSGRAVGDLIAILTLLKSLPLAYNRDLQEDKESLFDAIDTAAASLRALTHFLTEAEYDRVRMRKAAEIGLMTATDLADFLTTRGVPFRDAHGIVSRMAEESGEDDAKFLRLAKEVLRKHMKDHKTSDLDFLKADRSVERRKIEGGTARSAVAKQMEKAETKLKESRALLSRMKSQNSVVDKLLGLEPT